MNDHSPKSGIGLWKDNARLVVKRHYILLVILCLVSVFYGTEFSYVTSHANDTYDFVSGNTLEGTEYSFTVDGKSLLDIAEEHLGIDTDQVQDEIHERAEGSPLTDSLDLSKVTTRERGILASVTNYFSSGSFTEILVDAGTSLFQSRDLAQEILIFISFLFELSILIFIQNVYVAVLRRMFLEARLYDQVPVSHLLHFRVVRRWFRASLSMLLVAVLKMLWWLTIIGGIIKRYSYLLVPYIIAENPDIRPRQAVRLSRKMMYGHKMEAFKIDLSFIGWHILGIITFGILDGLWVVPYKTATISEYYAAIRDLAKEQAVEGTELLNDEYLFVKADDSLLRSTYADIEEDKHFIDDHRVTLPPARAFFAKNFGLWVGSTSEKKEYDEVDNVRQQIVAERAAIKGLQYPQRLNPRWDDSDIHLLRNARAIRTYTIWSIIAIFFIFSFIGWGWEVSIHLVKDGVFVNRGVMHGPWLPVYGSGVALILVVLARWRRNPVQEALLTILLCGTVEYMTSFYFEMTTGMRWWDYTGYFLNLNGRICAEGLMVFAIGGMAAVYLIVPLIDARLSRIDVRITATVCLILMVVFTCDMIYSRSHPNVGEGITDYDAYKESCTVRVADIPQPVLLPDETMQA